MYIDELNQDYDYYQPFYCEENIWHLCQWEPLLGHHKRKVVFVSNPQRQVLLWQQKISKTPNEAIVWDYHVILFTQPKEKEAWLVWDLDTRQALPTLASEYLQRSFSFPPMCPPHYLPMFRVIDADEYVDTFCSDRSHMPDPSQADSVPAPSWPPIILPHSPSNLQKFIEMEKPFVGEILDLVEMRDRFMRIFGKR